MAAPASPSCLLLRAQPAINCFSATFRAQTAQISAGSKNLANEKALLFERRRMSAKPAGVPPSYGLAASPTRAHTATGWSMDPQARSKHD